MQFGGKAALLTLSGEDDSQSPGVRRRNANETLLSKQRRRNFYEEWESVEHHQAYVGWR